MSAVADWKPAKEALVSEGDEAVIGVESEEESEMSYYFSRSNSLVNGLGGSAGFGENSLTRNDDSYTRIDLTSVFSAGLNFFGTNYTSMYVNNNGNVTFNSGQSTYTPYGITGNTRNPIIAPYFADVDTRGGTSYTTYGGNSRGTNLVYYDFDTINDVITITWDDVGFYYADNSLVNAFQLQISRVNSTDFDMAFRYESINWTTGDASGGSNGLGGTVARAGWSAGDGSNYYELNMSGSQSNMLRLDSLVGNTGRTGVWTFSVRNGQPDNPWLSPLANRNDFNGDGYADMLWFNSSTREIAIWSMQGFSRIGASAIQNTVNPAWDVVDTGDYDANGRTDILFRRISTGDLAVWSMDGLSRATSAISTSSGGGIASSTSIAGSGDLNGDGMDDIILHDVNGDVSVAFMESGLALGTQQVIQRGVNPDWTIAGMGDFDGDLDGDILWRNTSTGLVAVWLMDGATRTLGAVVQETVDSNWTLATTGDFDGNGTTDILWRHTDGRVANWLMNGTSRLGSGIINADSPLSDNWEIADATDFDGNGSDDILLRNSNDGTVAIWTVETSTRTGGAIVQDGVLSEWTIAS